MKKYLNKITILIMLIGITACNPSTDESTQSINTTSSILSVNSISSSELISSTNNTHSSVSSTNSLSSSSSSYVEKNWAAEEISLFNQIIGMTLPYIELSESYYFMDQSMLNELPTLVFGESSKDINYNELYQELLIDAGFTLDNYEPDYYDENFGFAEIMDFSLTIDQYVIKVGLAYWFGNEIDPDSQWNCYTWKENNQKPVEVLGDFLFIPKKDDGILGYTDYINKIVSIEGFSTLSVTDVMVNINKTELFFQFKKLSGNLSNTIALTKNLKSISFFEINKFSTNPLYHGSITVLTGNNSNSLIAATKPQSINKVINGIEVEGIQYSFDDATYFSICNLSAYVFQCTAIYFEFNN